MKASEEDGIGMDSDSEWVYEEVRAVIEEHIESVSI